MLTFQGCLSWIGQKLGLLTAANAAADSQSDTRRRPLCPTLSLLNAKNECISSDWHLVELSELDRFNGGSSAIATSTLFKCATSEARDNARNCLRVRTKEVFAKNPFLAGRLQTINKTVPKPKKAVLLVPDTASSLFDDLQSKAFIDTSPGHYSRTITLSESANHSDLQKVCQELFDVENGGRAVDRDCPLLQIAFIPTTENYSFFLIVSLNHIIGDGATYYCIYSQLSCAEPLTGLESETSKSKSKSAQDPVSMSIDRAPYWKFNRHRLVNTPQWIRWLQSRAFLLSNMLRLWYRRLTGFGVRYNHRIFRIRTDVVDQQISQIVLENPGIGSHASIPYISSNDFLTAKVASAFGALWTTMPVNLRSRFKDDFPDNCAGNYSPGLFLNEQFQSSPVLIRQAVQGMNERFKSNKTNSLPAENSPPNMLKSFLRSEGLSVSNFAGIFQPLMLPNAVPCFHTYLSYSDPSRPSVNGRAIICRFNPMDTKSLGLFFSAEERKVNRVCEALKDILEPVCEK